MTINILCYFLFSQLNSIDGKSIKHETKVDKKINWKKERLLGKEHHITHKDFVLVDTQIQTFPVHVHSKV
jgi:hypothetical protein